MSDPSLELQATLVATIRPVTGGRVYDKAPANAQYPYITLGEMQVLPDKADCIDGVEIFPRIDIWSRGVGFPEVKQLTKAVMALLDDQTLTVAGFNVPVFEHESTQYLRDPDGLTLHAAITFRGLIQPS